MTVDSHKPIMAAGGQDPLVWSEFPSEVRANLSDLTGQWHNSTIDFSNYTSNSSTPHLADVTYIVTTVTVLCIIVFLIGLAGNLLVIGVVSKNAEMHSPTNWFLVNLSIADLLVLLICMPSALIEMQLQTVWLLGNAMCKVVPYLEYTVAHSSVLTILAISFERYSAICYPLQVLYRCTTRRAMKIIISMWLVALLWAIPIIFFTGTDSDFHKVKLQNITVCVTNLDSMYKKGYLVSSIVMFFILPFLLLVFLYGFIGYRLERESHHQLPSPQTWRTRKQVITMLAIVILLFFVCLLPMRVFSLWNLFSSTAEKKRLGFEGYMHFLSFSRVMFYLNSAVNPLIYNVISTKFRAAFIDVICSKPYVRRRSSAMRMSVLLSRQNSASKARMNRACINYGLRGSALRGSLRT